MRGLSVCLPFHVLAPARASASTVVMDQPRSALSLRIFSIFTSAAPGSTWTSTSGKRFLITSAVAAAIGVQVPPVGPAEKTRLTFCASAGRGRSRARARAKTIQRVVLIGGNLLLNCPLTLNCPLALNCHLALPSPPSPFPLPRWGRGFKVRGRG